MKYKATVYFTDLKDNNYAYNAGDIFPRRGYRVSKKRIAELAGCDNRRGYPVIEEVIEDANGDMSRNKELV